MPMHHFFDPVRFGVEFVYTTAILILCVIIYYKTKDMYDLTLYKGIKYFRNAFLFFGFAYLTRFVLHLILISGISFDLFVPMRGIQLPLLALTGYFSTMAIFYLLYSALWKKFNAEHFLLSSNIIAVTFSLVAFITRSNIILISLQFFLLLCAVILTFANHRKRKSSHVRTLYILIMIFWLLNLYLIGPRRLLRFEIQAALHALSLIVFSVIYWKVSKWAK